MINNPNEITDLEIEENPDFQRAMIMLSNKFTNAKDFYHYWRMIPQMRLACPKIERTKPWWKEIPVP